MTENPHWRARLADVQDLLLVAHEVDHVVRALLTLTTLLADEWNQRDQGRLEQLVREAYDALTNPETEIDVRDWRKAVIDVLGPIVVRPREPDEDLFDRQAVMREIRGDAP